jgi:hypothetical protein
MHLVTSQQGSVLELGPAIVRKYACPSSGVLSQIRKKAKSRYKYAVRSLKRRKDHILSKKISSNLSRKHNN